MGKQACAAIDDCLRHQQTLVDTLSGADVAERAALILSIVSGFQVMRQMMGLTAVAEAKPEVLIDLITPLFQSLIEGSLAPPPVNR